MTTMTKPKVGWGDLLQVAWRRHRTLILVTSALVALASLAMLVLGSSLPTGSPFLDFASYLLLDQLSSTGLLFALAVGMFWGAPLVSREYELRTHLVAWGQDVPPSRWLAGQIAVLGGVAAVLAAVVGLTWGVLVDGVQGVFIGPREPFERGEFEVVAQVQVGYVLFAFALGVACSSLIRRTLPSMAVAAIGFLGLREVLGRWGREHYLPPVHTFEAWSTPGADYVRQVPADALYVASGYADANGVPITYRDDWDCGASTAAAQLDCLKANGVAGHFAEFQPIERLGLFQWIETGIFLVLAAGLLVLAWYWVKRARRV